MTAAQRIFTYGLVMSAVACGASGIISDGTLNQNTSSAMANVASASSNTTASESLADPAGNYTELCQQANQQGQNKWGGGDHGDHDGQNPNRKACWEAICKLNQDEQALRCSSQWQANVSSPNFQTLQADVCTLRQDACNDITAATPQCQTVITQFDTDVQNYWKSAPYQALEGSTQFQAVEQDANALEALNCFPCKTCNPNNPNGTTTTTTGGNTGNGDTAGTTTGSTAGGTGNTGNGDTAGATTQGTTTSVVIGNTTGAGGTTGGNTGNGDTAGGTTGANQ